MAPLSTDGSLLPCKHYPPGTVVASFKGGSSVVVQMYGSVFHNGGHCQFSVSYDDKTFVVLRTVLDNCFVGTGLNFTVQIPASIPACNRCTFAWSWVSAVGNRDFYMNCADISLSSNGGSLIGPNYTIANQPGYPTIPEFPPSTYHGLDLYAAAAANPVTIYGGTIITSKTLTTSTTFTTKKTTSTTKSLTTNTVKTTKTCIQKTVYKTVTKTITVR